MKNFTFNPASPRVMHLDINSCFATIEQQANPFLRGKPIVVAAYPTPNGCILASSIEAKVLGIKTGMRVMDGKALCPSLIVLTPDPWKYRNVHLKLKDLLLNYAPEVFPRSIDEFVLRPVASNLPQVAGEIKETIRKEIGEWITVSIGIAPNRYLAKVAAGLQKPNGLVEINKNNFLDWYSRLKLTDLTGIKMRNAARLNSLGIYTVLDFYHAPVWKLKAAFEAITGYYWYLRLHGYEIDNLSFARRSFGNSVALGKTYITPSQLAPILSNLVEKMAIRMLQSGYKAGGIHLGILYKDNSFWHKGVSLTRVLFDFRDIYKEAFRLLASSWCNKPVLNLAVSVFNLAPARTTQLELFDDIKKKESLISAVEAINERWGDFTLKPARMLGAEGVVLDRIAFGSVSSL